MFEIKNGVLIEFDKYGLGEGVENIQIPDGVKIIGANAFEFCDSIQSVSIPNSVTEIQDNAFSYCSNLQDVVLSHSITRIGAAAFQGCEALTQITLPPQLTVIEKSCFSGCNALQNVEFPTALSIIQEEAFEFCESLSKIVLPQTLTEIGSGAFRYCEALTAVVIPAGLSKCTGAFGGCKQLVDYVNIENSEYFAIVNDALCSKDQTMLVQCLPYVTGKYILADSVSQILDYAFFGMEQITEIVFPNECLIAPTAFNGCNGLPEKNGFTIVKDILIRYSGDSASVVIPENIKYIASWAFGKRENLKSVSFPKGLKEIGDHAFAYCSALQKVELPYYLCKLGESTFLKCSSLKYVSIPGSVKNIPYGCFDECASLTDVVFHEGLESISDMAFKDCRSLVELSFPYGLKRIGGIFSYDMSIKRVHIPESVREMDESGFSIYNLEWHVQANSYAKRFAEQNEDVYDYTIIESPTESFRVSETNQNPYICENDTLITYLGSGEEVFSVPGGIACIGKGSFAFSDITTIVIPKSVKFISSEAFSNASLLENIILLGDGLTVEIGAFRRCGNLKKVIALSANINFETGVFYKNDSERLLYENRDICLYCSAHSPLIQYAFDEKLKYAEITEQLSEVSIEELIAATNALEDKIVDTSLFCIEGNVLRGVNAGAIEDAGVVTVPQFIKTIDRGAFKDVPTVKRIVLQEGLERICEEAFMNCSAETINIPSSVISIGEYAFAGSFITNISIPAISVISPYTFAKCRFLTTVEFTASVMEIGEGAFSECAGLEHIALPNGLTEIKSKTFSNCLSLKMIALPEGIIEISDNAFLDCGRLILVSLPNSIVSIGEDAFKGRNLNCIFICNSNSHAFEYSQKNCIVTATNWEQVVERIKQKEALVEKQNPVVLQCGDTTITLTANYNVFYETVMQYADMAEELFTIFVENYTGLINDFSQDKARQLVADMEKAATKATSELEKYGIYVFNLKNYFFELNTGLRAVVDQLNSILEWMRELYDAKTDAIYDEGNAILLEANSKIKGLGYGIITSSPLIFAAYAIDEYRTEVKQRREASAFALEELKKLETKLDSRLAAAYTNTMETQIYPAIQSSLRVFAEHMLKTHIDFLEMFNILPQNMIDTYDIEKSNKLLNMEVENPQQQLATLFKALQYCPHNIRVYERLISQNVDVGELKEIASIVGITRELANCEQKIKMEAEQKRKEFAIAEQEARRNKERESLQAQISSLETELASLKGLFAGKRKKELNEQIAILQAKLRSV